MIKDFYNSIVMPTLSPEIQAKIMGSVVAERALNLTARINNAIEGASEYVLLSITDSAGVTRQPLLHIPTVIGWIENEEDDLSGSFPTTCLKSGTTDTISYDFTKQEIVDALENELALASAEAAIVPSLLSAKSSSVSITDIARDISSKVQNFPVAVRNGINSMVDSLKYAVRNTDEFCSQMLNNIFGKDTTAPFIRSILGTCTNTSGLFLVLNITADGFLDAIEQFQQKANSLIGRVIDSVDSALTWLLFSHAKSNFETMYLLSSFGNDENLSVDSSFEDLSFDNGFVDLGSASFELIQAMREYGIDVAHEQSVAIPTLGATWYIWSPRDGSHYYHVGFCRHMYDGDSCNLLNKVLTDAVQQPTPTTWDYILSKVSLCPAPFTHKDFESTVSAFDNRAAQSIVKSCNLIVPGLDLIAGHDFADSWTRTLSYTAGGLTYPASYWFHYGEDPMPTGTHDPRERDGLARYVLYPGKTRAVGSNLVSTYDLALEALKAYFDNLNSTKSDVLVCHFSTSTQLDGLYALRDDQTVISDRITAAKAVFTAAAATAAVVASVIAFGKLVNASQTAYVNAQRALANPSSSTNECISLVRKSNFLSRITGVAWSLTPGTLSVGDLASVRDIQKELTDTEAGSIRSLIATRDDDVVNQIKRYTV